MQVKSGNSVFALVLLSLILLGVSSSVSRADEDHDKELAAKARTILGNYCYHCHRGKGSNANGYAFNALLIDTMSTSDPDVVDRTEIIEAMYSGRMPPRNEKGLRSPSPAEVDIVKAWSDAGAPRFPKMASREFQSMQQVMERIREHFKALESEARKHYRYFTLSNLWNDANIDERQLRMTRTALAKALNSMSWEQEIYLPEAIDDNQTLFAVDLRKIGWSREHWKELISKYPYLIYKTSLDEIAEEMVRLSDGDQLLKHVRADWFITMGLRPERYHRMLFDLELPGLNSKKMTERDLEDFLGIDVRENIFGTRVRARRAAFIESGISGQNRMIERHELPQGGYYWRSYDFLNSNPRSIISEFPLGPKVSLPETLRGESDLSFVHDGGEILFSLPNGLQGYLLTTGQGERLQAGPIEIVGDSLKTSGNQLIVNGLSCVVCHREGMVEPPADIVRESAKDFGAYARRIKDLYPEEEKMRGLIVKDSERFLQAMKPIFDHFLEPEDFGNGPFPPVEPVGEVARQYLLTPMTLETVACELYYRDVEALRSQIKSNPKAGKIGLRILIREDLGSIKRDAWHTVDGLSLMQQAAQEIGFDPSE